MNIDSIKNSNDIYTFLLVMKHLDLDKFPRREVARLYDKMYHEGSSGRLPKRELLERLHEYERDILRTMSLAQQIQIPRSY